MPSTASKSIRLNRLVGFRSTIHLKKVPQAIVIEGTIEGTRLKLHIDAGEVSYTPSDHYLPQDALVGDELSPQSKLVGLHVGQTWTVPVYNPLQPESPMEVLEATVKGHETMNWNGQGVDVLVGDLSNAIRARRSARRARRAASFGCSTTARCCARKRGSSARGWRSCGCRPTNRPN